jgi:hypothetical protein
MAMAFDVSTDRDQPKNVMSWMINLPTDSPQIRPSASQHKVIPSCVVDKYISILERICCTLRAFLFHSFTFRASWEERTFTSANSVATKKPFNRIIIIVITIHQFIIIR